MDLSCLMLDLLKPGISCLVFFFYYPFDYEKITIKFKLNMSRDSNSVFKRVLFYPNIKSHASNPSYNRHGH